jgi:hypothetical protein
MRTQHNEWSVGVHLNLLMFMSHLMAQFVEALRYEPQGRGTDSLWGHQDFSLTESF